MNNSVFDNPLWWVIPLILLGSFWVNHGNSIPHFKGFGKKSEEFSGTITENKESKPKEDEPNS